jgi:hypothetical protein
MLAGNLTNHRARCPQQNNILNLLFCQRFGANYGLFE